MNRIRLALRVLMHGPEPTPAPQPLERLIWQQSTPAAIAPPSAPPHECPRLFPDRGDAEVRAAVALAEASIAKDDALDAWTHGLSRRPENARSGDEFERLSAAKKDIDAAWSAAHGAYAVAARDFRSHYRRRVQGVDL